MKSLKSAFCALLIGTAAFGTLATAQANDWDEQPTVKKTVAPENPTENEGMVMATIEIDDKGFVVSAKIAKSTDTSLDPAVLDAVKQWRFNPAKKSGSAVACQINVPFKFRSS